jgi:hypothetical protein
LSRTPMALSPFLGFGRRPYCCHQKRRSPPPKAPSIES